MGRTSLVDGTALSYLFIANRHAGDGDLALIRRGTERLRKNGTARLVFTSSIEEVGMTVAQAPPETTFGAAGGDGTIHSLVNALSAQRRLDRPVGLLPVGTGNDLARNAGLPGDPLSAAEMICSGARRRLPRAEHDGRVVLNSAHTGLGIAGARRADDLKDRLGSLAYSVAALIAMAEFDGMSISLTLDGEHFHDGECTAIAVAVAGVGEGVGARSCRHRASRIRRTRSPWSWPMRRALSSERASRRWSRATACRKG